MKVFDVITIKIEAANPIYKTKNKSYCFYNHEQNI